MPIFVPYVMDNLKKNVKFVCTNDALNLGQGLSMPTHKATASHCYENLLKVKELDHSTPSTRRTIDNNLIRYICYHCDKSFTQKSNLKRHLQRGHKKVAIIRCLECNLKFLSTLALEAHIKKIHEEKLCKACEATIVDVNTIATDETCKKFHCRYCHKGFSFSETLNKHIESFHKKKRRFHCEHCNSSFKQKGHYSHHMNSVHLKLKPYKCDDCDRYFSTSVNLARHLSILHQKLQPLKCKHCLNEVTFCNKAALNKHYDSVHRTKAIIPKDKAANEILKKYRCSECDKSFAWSKSLKNHIESFHMNIRPYHCDDCNTSFSQKGHYTHHMKSVHLKIKPFNCEECELSFSTRVTLTRHTALMHKKQHPVKCKHCSIDIIFCDKAALKRHYESVHQQPKLLNCKLCDKDFANKKTLWKHNARYHDNSALTRPKPIPKLNNEKVEYRIITEGFTAPLVIINEEIGTDVKDKENVNKGNKDFVDFKNKNEFKESEVVNKMDKLLESPSTLHRESSNLVVVKKELNEENAINSQGKNDAIYFEGHNTSFFIEVGLLP